MNAFVWMALTLALRKVYRILAHASIVSISCFTKLIDFLEILRTLLKDKSILFILGAPVYLSFPHFYKADPKLLDAIEGLKPIEKLHGSYFKIQPVSKKA